MHIMFRSSLLASPHVKKREAILNRIDTITTTLLQHNHNFLEKRRLIQQLLTYLKYRADVGIEEKALYSLTQCRLSGVIGERTTKHFLKYGLFDNGKPTINKKALHALTILALQNKLNLKTAFQYIKDTLSNPVVQTQAYESAEMLLNTLPQRVEDHHLTFWKAWNIVKYVVKHDVFFQLHQTAKNHLTYIEEYVKKEGTDKTYKFTMFWKRIMEKVKPF